MKPFYKLATNYTDLIPSNFLPLELELWCLLANT